MVAAARGGLPGNYRPPAVSHWLQDLRKNTLRLLWDSPALAGFLFTLGAAGDATPLLARLGLRMGTICLPSAQFFF